ncbi:DUF6286 domain-containing protein [Streptomyces sp. KLOTTS4A1]|uniref:DUF6286 domain-containing protein n=1 Tax=Streptomyces sp. KLOTTS4A1 TaxID=3390996 RepID=UPI0039F5CA66
MSEGPEGDRAAAPGPGSEGGTRRLPVLEKAAEPEAREAAAAGARQAAAAVAREAGAAVVPLTEEPGTLDQSASAARYGRLRSPARDGDGGRLWSVRRIPAGVLALLLAAGAGLLLYDLASVRAGRTAMTWRRELAEQLARRPLDDGWVLAAAWLAVLLGAGLLVCAAAPGHRSALPMRDDSGEVRAWLDTGAAALVLRERALGVEGVRSVRVRVRRSKVDVRAVAPLHALDDVRADLDAALGAGLGSLGLVAGPALSVTVARPGRSWRPGPFAKGA